MAKKDKDDAPINPATAAHDRDAAAPKPASKDMDADLEAKRSGPPATPVTPQPMADPAGGIPEQSEQFDRSGPVPDPRTTEQKLKDPTFDPSGEERLKLAEESRRTGSGGHYPPTTDVDERGDPMAPGERNPDREP